MLKSHKRSSNSVKLWQGPQQSGSVNVLCAGAKYKVKLFIYFLEWRSDWLDSSLAQEPANGEVGLFV